VPLARALAFYFLGRSVAPGWNIEDKLFSITVDNASVNGLIIDNLRENLVGKEMLHSEGALLHIRCACHVLNQIVQDRLTTV
jgi:hypothetical protein